MNLLETRGPHAFGPWTITQLVEWEGEAFPHASLFPGIPVNAIREASPSGIHGRLTESGIIMATQHFILRHNDLVILLELGTGNGKTRPAEGYWDHQNLPYLETLAALNIAPEDVAYVFLSHLHVDHVGFATTWQDNRWVPTFPKAKYIINRAEWDYWSNLPSDDPHWHPCLEDSVWPLKDSRVVHYVQDGQCVEGLRVHEAPGHTPGNLLFEVEGQNLWFLGDLLHHPAQVAHPEWPSAAYDVDPELNARERRHYFKRFADSDAVLFTVHMGNPFGIIETAPGQFFAK